jgi:hypothetical protein
MRALRVVARLLAEASPAAPPCELCGAVTADSGGLLVINDSLTADRAAAEPHRQVLADVAVGVGDPAKRDTGQTLNGDLDPGLFVCLAHRRLCWLFAGVVAPAGRDHCPVSARRPSRTRPSSSTTTAHAAGSMSRSLATCVRRLATYCEIAIRTMAGRRRRDIEAEGHGRIHAGPQ